MKLELSRRTWLVARREAIERSRSKAFKISTGFLLVAGPVMVMLGQVLPGLIEDDPAQLGIAGGVPSGTMNALTGTAKAIDFEYELTEFDSVTQAETSLTDGDLDAILVDGTTIKFRAETNSEIVFVLNTAVQAASLRSKVDALGLTVEDIASIISPEPLGISILDPPDEHETLPLAVAFIGVVILYMLIVLYGQWVLLGVVEEKTSRVAEVLLGAISPTELVTGKVVGNLSLAIAQTLAGAIAGAIAVTLFGSSIEFPGVAPTGALVALVSLAMGLIFYAFAYAAAGATVSRPEDASSAAMPIIMLLLIGYIGSLVLVVSDPDSIGSVVLSLLPVSAPIAMPARMAVGTPAWWELALASIFMSVAIVGMARLSGRIYMGAILQTGPRIGLLTSVQTFSRVINLELDPPRYKTRCRPPRPATASRTLWRAQSRSRRSVHRQVLRWLPF